MDIGEVSDLERGFLSPVDRGVELTRGVERRHGDRVRLDLGVAAETQQGRAEYLSGLAPQGEIAQAGCNDGSFKGECAIAHILVFGLRGVH